MTCASSALRDRDWRRPPVLLTACQSVCIRKSPARCEASRLSKTAGQPSGLSPTALTPRSRSDSNGRFEAAKPAHGPKLLVKRPGLGERRGVIVTSRTFKQRLRQLGPRADRTQQRDRLVLEALGPLVVAATVREFGQQPRPSRSQRGP